MNKERYLELMKTVRISEDAIVEARKTLEIFDDTRNWNAKYTDDQDRTDKFDYLKLDPRIIAGRGCSSLDIAKETLRNEWYKLRDELNKLEAK